eukprot:m.347354 g.347354  ORF g.347354 m.347354 type:complete len:78 (+) comp16144_c0_seq31:6671-6904(+)
MCSSFVLWFLPCCLNDSPSTFSLFLLPLEDPNCSFNSHTHSLSPSLSRNCSFCFILFPRIALDFDFANNLDKPVTAV